MKGNTGAVREIASAGRKMAGEVMISPVVETLTRVGYGVRGLIYIVMGLLAVQVAMGGRGAAADQQGAIATLARQPMGTVLLAVVVVGLAAYALWGLIRAFLDPLHKGSDAKGLVARLGFLVSGLSYGFLAIPAYNLLTGAGRPAQSGAQGAQTQQSVASILTRPWGRWAVGIVGLIVIGAGLMMIYQGFRRPLDQPFTMYNLTAQQMIWVKRMARFGSVARGIVLSLVGLFLSLAAYRLDPGQAQGYDGALMALARQPYGAWLLGIVALGLVAFGLYSLLGAAWFRLRR